MECTSISLLPVQTLEVVTFQYNFYYRAVQIEASPLSLLQKHHSYESEDGLAISWLLSSRGQSRSSNKRDMKHGVDFFSSFISVAT